MAELNRDFLDLLEAFDELEVRFLVVGAHALGVHGVPRATGDLDLWIRPDSENGTKAWQALDRFGASVRAHGLRAEDLATAGTVYQVGLPPFRIDVLTQISGCDFEQAWADRVERTVDGRRLAYLGLASLIRNKRATGRTKDLLDIELLKEAGVDVDAAEGETGEDGSTAPGSSTPES